MTSSSEIIKVENNDNVRVPMEKDKRFLIRQQLYYLFHAFRCTRLAYTTGQGDCQNQHCIMMRNVVKHIPQCNLGKDCKFPHCPSSKEIIRHWKNCNDVECQVCTPLRRNSNTRKNEETLNGEYSAPNRSLNEESWRSKLWKIREKFVLKLTDDILPVKVCEDVRIHPNYVEVAEYVKHFETEAFKKAESLHLYIRQLSEKFEIIYQQLLPKRCSRESDNRLLESLNESSKSRLEKFYLLIKDEIEKFYSACGGNPRDLFESPVKEEKTVKMENDFNQNNGSSESSLKTVSSENNSLVKQEPLESPCNSTTVSPFKPMSSAEVTVDLKMSPDSTSGPNKDVVSSNYKTWLKEDLLKMFTKIHQELVEEKDSEPFRLPVDWKLLDIPDYPLIIKNPIDLSSIFEKLKSGVYNDPWEVVDDYWLMLNNAWLYNKKTSKVYKMCNTLAKLFENKIDDIMMACGYCCGREYVYLPQVLICCTPNVCLIVRDAVYYAFQNDKFNGEKIINELTSDKYICCEKCFNDSVDEISFLNAESNATCKVKKTLLTKCRNNVKENEEFIFCRHCNRKWHRVCANHVDEIWRDGFYCPSCVVKNQIKIKKNQFKAKHMPHNELSRFIETRVNTYLKQKDPTVDDVIIRVLSSSDKTVEVKPGMKSHYCETFEMPESFNYRLKALFAFQEIDGQEVCFFGLHVQEYGSECPDPNSRRVYIAYLDSVHYFSPRRHRTDVYHEFLVGYLEYVKRLGFTMAHIWACPPGEGDDYIFHMHPPEQKLPKPKRLQEWYIKMLDKAIKENIVIDYHDIFSDALQSNMVSPTELPYFEGDYWPNALEDIFKEINEETNRRMKTYSDLTPTSNEVDGPHKDVISKNNLSKMDKKPKKRKLKRMNSLSHKRKRTNGSESVNDISRRVLELMEKRKENFFVIRLHSQGEAANLPPINDPDPLVTSDLMDGRDKFLCLARERHLEFSSLRRARYSSIVFCYELHMEHRHSVLYDCNCCGRQIELRWTCRVCDDFELCESCHGRESHPHPLYRVDPDDLLSGRSDDQLLAAAVGGDGTRSAAVASLGGGGAISDTTSGATAAAAADASGDADGTSAEFHDTTRARMVRYSQSLQHACQCRDANCRINFCAKMKSMIKHLQFCQVPRSICKTCMSFVRICVVHAKFCNDPKCAVPNCLTYRFNWKQQSSQQRMQQAQMLRRRVALMQRGTSMTGGDNVVPSVSVSSNPGSIPATPSSAITSTSSLITPVSVTASDSQAIPVAAPASVVSLSISSDYSLNMPSAAAPSSSSSSCSRMINPGKVADPIHDDVIKQQQQQLHQMPSMLPSSYSTPLITGTPSSGMLQYTGQPQLLPPSAQPPQQYHHQQQQFQHQVMIQQQQQQQVMNNSAVVGGGGLSINGNGLQPMMPPQYAAANSMQNHHPHMAQHMNNIITEDDIKIVKQKYLQLTKLCQSNDDFKRQWNEFLTSNLRYRTAYEFLAVRLIPTGMQNANMMAAAGRRQVGMMQQQPGSLMMATAPVGPQPEYIYGGPPPGSQVPPQHMPVYHQHWDQQQQLMYKDNKQCYYMPQAYFHPAQQQQQQAVRYPSHMMLPPPVSHKPGYRCLPMHGGYGGPPPPQYYPVSMPDPQQQQQQPFLPVQPPSPGGLQQQQSAASSGTAPVTPGTPIPAAATPTTPNLSPGKAAYAGHQPQPVFLTNNSSMLQQQQQQINTMVINPQQQQQ